MALKDWEKEKRKERKGLKGVRKIKNKNKEKVLKE